MDRELVSAGNEATIVEAALRPKVGKTKNCRIGARDLIIVDRKHPKPNAMTGVTIDKIERAARNDAISDLPRIGPSSVAARHQVTREKGIIEHTGSNAHPAQ